MKKIRDFIISLFGGVTQEENRETQREYRRLGEYMAYYKQKLFMDGMNGTAADEWCKKAYDNVCE